MNAKQLLGVAAIIALTAAPAAAGKPAQRVTVTDGLGDQLPVAAATAPVHGDRAHDLVQVVLQVEGRHLRITLATAGAIATDAFAGYDITAASSGTCSGTVFDQGFPVEFRFRAGPDGRGALYVKACRTALRLPVLVRGSTVSAVVPLTELPDVRRTTLRGVHVSAGATDAPDAGTMRLALDTAETAERLPVP